MKSDHVWFLYQQGVELTARFDLYLDEVAGLCSPAETELVQYFRDQLEPIRRDLAAGITELAELGFGAELEASAARDHISNYKNAAARLQERHFDLRFFPVQPAIPPEVYVLLRDFFPPRTFSKINQWSRTSPITTSSTQHVQPEGWDAQSFYACRTWNSEIPSCGRRLSTRWVMRFMRMTVSPTNSWTSMALPSARKTRPFTGHPKFTPTRLRCILQGLLISVRL